MDNIQRTLAKDGGTIGKTKDGDFVSSSYTVQSFDKDIVRDVFEETIDLDNQD